MSIWPGLLAVTLAWSSGLAPQVSPPKPLPRAALVKLGKAATAFVQVRASDGVADGTAFCVHPAGLFVTNEHVITRTGSAKSITLVLNAGEAGQRILTASVARLDKDLDLALLRVENAEKLPALALGEEADLAELTELVAFGFPFGRDLAAGEGEYPAVSVNSGSATALRRKGDELAVLQVDITLHPGNSGGPVLDRAGRVAGVVAAGVRGAGVNFVIPVNQVRHFLAKPDLQFAPPPLTAADLGRPVLFQARAVQPVPSDSPLVLDLHLRTPDGKEARHRMEPAGDDYRVTTEAVPALLVELTASYPGGSVRASAPDQAFTLGGKSHRLREVLRLHGGPKPRVTFRDGTTVEGAPGGLDAVPLRIGPQETPTDLGRAAVVDVTLPDALDRVTATVVAMRDGQEVDRLSAEVPVEGAQPSGGRAGAPMVRPPALAKSPTVVTASGPIADVVVGGGGRFLILAVPRQKVVDVFDVQEARIVRSIPVLGDVKIAAGRDKLLIVYPGEVRVQRWSLTTFTFEAETTFVMKAPLREVAMGSASEGPLCLYGYEWDRFNETVFFDVQTMKRIEGSYDPQSTFAMGSQFLRAAANGKLFVCATKTLQACTVAGDKFFRHEGRQARAPHPAPDGRAVYTANGILRPDLSMLVPSEFALIPSQHGPYYLSLGRHAHRLTLRPFRYPQQQHAGNHFFQLSLFLADDYYLLAPLPPYDGLQGMQAHEPGVLSWDKRICLLPDARLLITVPASNDRLILHRFDVDELVEQYGGDYLYVASRPPREAVRGQTYSYPLVVKSRRGGVRTRLELGPKGMSLAADGTITWPVPADFAEKETTVIVALADAQGQEMFHTFTVAVPQ